MILPSDHKARELALDVTQSHHVEAPAGSGKTMLLVARFIRLLATVSHPHNILALTFTNKAAGEMKTRIGELFRRAEQGVAAENDLDASLLKSARQALRQHRSRRFLLLSPEELQVMTFHGFCYNIVRRAPLEAGLPPDSAVLEETDQALLLDESVRDMIFELVRRPEGAPEQRAFESRLLRLDNRLAVFADEIKDLVSKRDLFSDLVHALRIHPDMAAFEAALAKSLEALVDCFLKEAKQAFCSTSVGRQWEALWLDLKERGAPNVRVLPELVPGTAWQDLSSWQAIAAALTTNAGNPRKSMGPINGGFYKGFSAGPWGKSVKGLSPEVARMLRGLKDLPDYGVSPTDVEALADLIILVARAIRAYERKCQQRHVLDFVDLEQGALRVLGEDQVSDMQLCLDHRIQHLLVDEFQDTSRSQWELIQRTCAGWVPGDGRTVFVVGDPKQSIYAFRKAEVRLFLEAKKGIPVSGQGLLPVTNVRLETNFRSADPLVRWTNEFFEHTVMAKAKSAFDEVPFQPSSAHASAKCDVAGPAVSLSLFFADKTVLDPAEAEADWLARSVKQIEAEGTGQVSIGILLFARNRLGLYLRALRDNNVSVRVKEGLLVAEQPEVTHLFQLCTALCRPQDDLAWACLVRSPWSWVDASVLLEVAGMAPAPWPNKLKRAAGKHPELDRVQHALGLGRQRLGRDSLAQVVRDVWMALGGPEKVASSFGAEGVANCLCFLEVLESVETGIAEETLARVDLALEGLYAPESPHAAAAGVDLMTVHGAKGLEFDVVFLPFLDWRPLAAGKPPAYLMERCPGESSLPLIAMGPDRRREEPEPAYGALKRLRDGRRIGELKRLLYVGITRARRQLFLSGLAQDSKEGLKAPKYSALDWVLDHAGKKQREPVLTFCNPPGADVTAEKEKEVFSLPSPMPFEPQPLPYVVETPSELAQSTSDTKGGAREDAGGLDAAIRGTVTHQVIESLWRKGGLPSGQRIATALASKGINPDRAAAMASEIEAEVQACQKEEFFCRLLDRAQPGGKSEWAMEALRQPGAVRAGILDFVRQEGGLWWIVDFKTSRPEAGETESDFLKQEIERYRLQLEAYRDMLAKAKGIDPGQIRVGLYFTGIQKWCEISI